MLAVPWRQQTPLTESVVLEFWFLRVPRLAELEWNVVVDECLWHSLVKGRSSHRVCVCACVRSSVSAGLDRCPEQPLTRLAASPATGLSARLQIREVWRDICGRQGTSHTRARAPCTHTVHARRARA